MTLANTEGVFFPEDVASGAKTNSSSARVVDASMVTWGVPPRPLPPRPSGGGAATDVLQGQVLSASVGAAVAGLRWHPVALRLQLAGGARPPQVWLLLHAVSSEACLLFCLCPQLFFG